MYVLPLLAIVLYIEPTDKSKQLHSSDWPATVKVHVLKTDTTDSRVGLGPNTYILKLSLGHLGSILFQETDLW